jgi:ParB-like chromosome segregation protein Spo0J
MAEHQDDMHGEEGIPSPAGGQVKLAFEPEGISIPLAALLPSRPVREQDRKLAKYAAVLASIREVGVIEPPAVFPLARGKTSTPSQYLVLDGHLRVEALKELGHREVFCLISTDDEAYTYNCRVNRIPPIQEHFMIMRALERGIEEGRIARALHVDVARIRSRRDMLRGICPEAVALLRNAPIAAGTFHYLRAVKPERQIDIAEMMRQAGTYTGPYCQALVAATAKHQRVAAHKPPAKLAIKPADLARLQLEVESLQRDLQVYEEDYGRNFLRLVGVRGYLDRLLANERVARFLGARHAELLEGFRQIVEATSLES